MNDHKKQLFDLIEAYAAARISGNALLQQISVANLIQFVDSVEITQPEQEEDGGQG
jgi:hypothetical protein